MSSTCETECGGVNIFSYSKNLHQSRNSEQRQAFSFSNHTFRNLISNIRRLCSSADQQDSNSSSLSRPFVTIFWTLIDWCCSRFFDWVYNNKQWLSVICEDSEYITKIFLFRLTKRSKFCKAIFCCTVNAGLLGGRRAAISLDFPKRATLTVLCTHSWAVSYSNRY